MLGTLNEISKKYGGYAIAGMAGTAFGYWLASVNGSGSSSSDPFSCFELDSPKKKDKKKKNKKKKNKKNKLLNE